MISKKIQIIYIMGLSISFLGLGILFYLYISLNYFLEAPPHIKLIGILAGCFALGLVLFGGSTSIATMDKYERDTQQ